MSNYKEVVEAKRKELVDTLVTYIEANPTSWEAGWHRVSKEPAFNGKTGKKYNGINAFYLYVLSMIKGYNDPRWITYQQAQEMGGNVNPGEKSSTVFYWSWYDTKTKKPYDRATVEGMTAEERKRYEDENIRPVHKYYQVFNAEQCRNLPKYEKAQEAHEMTAEELARQNALIETVIKNSAAPVNYDGGSNAYYKPSDDTIHLPEIKVFKSMQDYYATALHEIAHSTGHETRLNRGLTTSFGTPEYAKEELRAELASVFMQSELGIELEGRHIENHAAYLASWLKTVKSNPKELFNAASDAEKIAEYVKEKYTKESAETFTEDSSNKVDENAFEKAKTRAWVAIDRIEETYIETHNEYFEYMPGLSLYKSKEFDIWKIGNKDIRKLEAKDVFYTEAEAQEAFAEAKRFATAQQTMNSALEAMTYAELSDWMQKNGKNAYFGDSIFTSYAERILEEKKAQFEQVGTAEQAEQAENRMTFEQKRGEYEIKFKGLRLSTSELPKDVRDATLWLIKNGYQNEDEVQSALHSRMTSSWSDEPRAEEKDNARITKAYQKYLENTKKEQPQQVEQVGLNKSAYTVEIFNIGISSPVGEEAKKVLKPYIGKKLEVGFAENLAADILNRFGKKNQPVSLDGKTNLIDEDYFSLNYSVQKNGKTVYAGFIPSDRAEGIIENIKSREESRANSPEFFSSQEINKAKYILQHLVPELEQARQAKQVQQVEQSQQAEQAKQVGQVRQIGKGKFEILIPQELVGKEYGKSQLIKVPKGEYSNFVFFAPKALLKSGENGMMKMTVRAGQNFSLKNDGRKVDVNGEELGAVMAGQEIGKAAQRVAPSKNAPLLERLAQNVPDIMKAQPNWCAYRTHWNAEKDKKDKTILSPVDGSWAKSNDSTTWSTFDAAMQFAMDNNCEGLSFALNGSGIVCIDLDKCIVKNGKLNNKPTDKPEGEMNDIANKLVQELSDTYCEKSASENGLHFFLSDDILKQQYANRTEFPNGDELEVYDDARFISMTGNLQSQTKELGKCPQETLGFIRKSLGKRIEYNPKNFTPGKLSNQTDAQLIERIERSAKGEIFKQLYAGGNVAGATHSQNDFALLNILAFFSDGNAEQMERIFRSSGLYRERKDKYIRHSIDKAIGGLKVRITDGYGNSYGRKNGNVGSNRK